MKSKLRIYHFALFGIVLLFINSCKQDKAIEPVSSIKTDKVSVYQMEIVPLISKNITL